MSVVSLEHAFIPFQFRTIGHSLPSHSVSTVVHALIRTIVDFSNSIYAGLSSLNLSTPQSILNAAVSLISGLLWFTLWFAGYQPSVGTLSTGFLCPSESSSKFNKQLFGRGSSFIHQDCLYPGL